MQRTCLITIEIGSLVVQIGRQ